MASMREVNRVRENWFSSHGRQTCPAEAELLDGRFDSSPQTVSVHRRTVSRRKSSKHAVRETQLERVELRLRGAISGVRIRARPHSCTPEVAGATVRTLVSR